MKVSSLFQNSVYFYFSCTLYYTTGKKWRGRQRYLRAICWHYLLPGSPLCLFATYYFNPLLPICSASPLKRKKNISFFLSPYKAKPEHQGEPCVQLGLCRLSAVTGHHLEIITHPNKPSRLNMCKGTRRVQTRYLNCHKFFLEVRFILTLLDKIKRPRMSPLYSYPRQTTENN